MKKMITSATVGASTCWIPVPFINVVMRYHQDQILPKEYSRGYRGYLHAAFTIARKDGLFPFVRSAGPIMAEKFLQTTGLFFWLDFTRDKIKHTENWGTDHIGTSPTTLRFFYISAGTYLGLMSGYPMFTLRNLVENMPLNSKGELFFGSYAEAFWKTLGDNFEFTALWNGFPRYLAKQGPPIFATLWFADVLGLLKQYHVDGIVLPDS